MCFLLTCDAIFGASYNIASLRVLFREAHDMDSRFFSTRNFSVKNRKRGVGGSTMLNKKRAPHRRLLPSQSGSARLRALEKQNCLC